MVGVSASIPVFDRKRVESLPHVRPIIGIIGGIGSGKSFVASLFGELGAYVIKSDDLVHDVYRQPAVLQTLRTWWGEDVISADGSVNRKAVAAWVFSDRAELKRLEGLVYPLVNAERERLMVEAAKDPAVTAFVWDTPMLVETDLHQLCDAVVFVDAPLDVRLARVSKRGWAAEELLRREKLQLALDKKRTVSDYVLSNAAPAEAVLHQVRQIFSSIKDSSETKRQRASFIELNRSV